MSQNSNKRNRNFNEEEKELLIQLVQDDIKGSNVLFGKFSGVVSKKKKDETWKNIADEINRVNGRGDRTANDVKKKYQNLSADTRKKERARKHHESGTGGGPHKKFKFSDSENLILATVAEEQISGIKGGIESQSLANQSSQEDLFTEDTEHQRISIMDTYNSDPEIMSLTGYLDLMSVNCLLLLIENFLSFSYLQYAVT